MTKKEKEEERIERIIRGLIKLPENRRCINCSSLGPQYVCTTFSTFVCTNCSGVHREFTHRVKSVSMAKFSAEEVSALQAGGNEKARQIYFKNWDVLRNSYPDGSNLHRLRDFIKHVYVDRRYSGDKTQDGLPRLRVNHKEEIHDRKLGLYSGGLRSPNYEDRYERRSLPSGRSDEKNLKYYFDERSPRYAQENSRYGGFKRSPVRFEVVDDRFRDDGLRSGRDGSHRFSVGGRKNFSRSGSPAARPVKSIVEENAQRRLVDEHSKATDKKEADASACSQIASSSTKESIEGREVIDKNQKSDSLIDFNANSTPSDAAATPQTQENHPSSSVGNCNSDESSKKQDAPPVPKPNTLEFLLYELSVPSVEPASSSTSDLTNNDKHPAISGANAVTSGAGVSEAVPQAQMSSLPSNNSAPTNAPAGNSTGNLLALPNTTDSSASAQESNLPDANDSSAPAIRQLSTSSGTTDASKPASGDNKFVGDVLPGTTEENASSSFDNFDAAPSATTMTVQSSDGCSLQAQSDIHGDSNSQVSNGQPVFEMQQHQFSAFPAADTGSSGQQGSITSDGIVNNQTWSSTVSAEQRPQDITKAGEASDSSLKPQQHSVETKYIGRKELPADLFTASYSSVPGSVPGWHGSVPYGMGYNNMQYYPNAMPMQQYPHQPQAKPFNPFDYGSDTPTMPMSVSLFPSMENLRIATPNMSAPGAVSPPTSGIGATSSALMAAPIPSYASAMPLQTSAGAYMGQQLHLNTPPSRPQVGGGFGGDAFFGLPNMVQQSSGGYPLSIPPKRNPFG